MPMPEEKLFQYNGPSEKFREAFDTYGTKLEQFYKSILPKKDFENFARLFSPEIYFTLLDNTLKGDSGGNEDSNQNARLLSTLGKEDIMHPHLFSLSHSLYAMEEIYARELDRRALTYVGLKPSTWVDREEMQDWRQSLPNAGVQMDVLKAVNDKSLIELIRTWQDRITEYNGEQLYKIIKSLRPVKLHKLSPDSVEGYKELMNLDKADSFAIQHDNAVGHIILYPKSDAITLGEQNALKIKGTNHLKTTVGIYLSEIVTGSSIAETLKGSGIPTYLLPIIHETNHVANYALEKLPLMTLSTILKNLALNQQ